MGNKDTRKLVLREMQRYEAFADKMPGKDIKKFKRKERQAGKTVIREELKRGESQKKEK